MVAVNTIYHRQYVKSHCCPAVSTTSWSPCQTNKSTGKRPNASEGERESLNGPGQVHDLSWSEIMRNLVHLIIQPGHLKITFHQISGWRKLTLFPSNLSSAREIFPCRRLDTDVTGALWCRHRYHDPAGLT